MPDSVGDTVHIDETFDAVHHVSAIYPADTNLTVTLTAHANANTWSAWAELTDSGATTFSSLLAAQKCHITAFYVEELSDIDTIYMMEIAYGAAKVQIAAGRFAGATKFQVPPGNFRFWAPDIPAGETVYYRLKSASAVADTAQIHLRYHLH